MSWSQQVVSTDRGTFEIFVSGAGEPICISHLYEAFTEKGDAFAEHFTKHRTVYLINLKNAGNSDKAKTKSELTMRETIKDLESIRIALGHERWSFAGHSTGGFLGLTYAITFPESLESFIISCSSPSKEFMNNEHCLYNPKGKFGNEYMKIFLTLFFPFSTKKQKTRALRKWIEYSLHRPEKYDQYFSSNDQSESKTIGSRIKAYIKDLQHYDVRKELPHIRIPALILCGEHDVQCPAIYSKEMHKLITNSKLTIFKESNHFPYIEEAEAYQREIKLFFDNIDNGNKSF